MISFEGTHGKQLRFHLIFGEEETTATAIPRQERIRGHRILFVPTHSTNTNNREEGVCLAVQVPEEEFGGDLTGAA